MAFVLFDPAQDLESAAYARQVFYMHHNTTKFPVSLRQSKVHAQLKSKDV